MYPIDFISKKNQKSETATTTSLDFLLLTSEPEDTPLYSHAPFLTYTNRYWARRRVLRNARRLRREQLS